MEGFLLINKPRGWTSFDVVAKVRSIARAATGNRKIKVGHSGTLDPMATGLLVIAIGKYTKKIDSIMGLDKTYSGRMVLGATSDTADAEGEITPVSNEVPGKGEVERAFENLRGKIDQTPPAYSAIKINGVRAYDLARKGKVPELKPRPVTIYKFEITSYNYPYVEFVADVSSGTYIRSLAVSVGETLGTGTYLDRLERTTIGEFRLDDAHEITELASGYNLLTKTLILDPMP
jgi:tRNA pseudouridine55 synthase